MLSILKRCSLGGDSGLFHQHLDGFMLCLPSLLSTSLVVNRTVTNVIAAAGPFHGFKKQLQSWARYMHNQNMHVLIKFDVIIRKAINSFSC